MRGSRIPHETTSTLPLSKGVEHLWEECQVPLNACVIRYWNRKKKALDHIVLVTTDQRLNGAMDRASLRRASRD